MAKISFSRSNCQKAGRQWSFFTLAVLVLVIVDVLAVTVAVGVESDTHPLGGNQRVLWVLWVRLSMTYLQALLTLSEPYWLTQRVADAVTDDGYVAGSPRFCLAGAGNGEGQV